MDKASDLETRAAAEYALAQQCFRDHQGAPYRFQDQIREIQKTIQHVDEDGLVHQPGLVAARIPFPDIDLDLDLDAGTERMLLTSSCSPLKDPLISLSFSDVTAFEALRELRISPEPLDLGYDIKKEYQQYLSDIHSKRFCNVMNEWLPLSPIDVDRDEGLSFSAASSRWQKLAHRELDRENIEVSEAAKQLVRNTEDTGLAWGTRRLSGDALGLLGQRRAYPEPVSPPLSPTSSIDHPFVPSPRTAVIDLTSAPSSPPNSPVMKLQRDLQNGCVDSEPAAPPPSSRSSSPLHGIQCFGSPHCKISSLKIDVPLVMSSPFQPDESNSFLDAMEVCDLNTDQLELHATGAQGFFDDAIETIIDSCHGRTVRMVEEERLNLTDSFLRVQVPALNFDHPEPKWRGHLLNPKVQFDWITRENPIAFQLPRASSLAQLGTSLKWTPIPPGTGRVSSNETLEPPGSASRRYLILEVPSVGSEDYISKAKNLSILHIIDDEEIESDTPSPDDPSCEPSEVASAAETPMNYCNRYSLETILKSDSLAARRSLRKKAVEESEGLLPLSNDSSATSKLLSSFIKLRHPKKLKLTADPQQNARPTTQDTAKPLAKGNFNQVPRNEINSELFNAPAPSFCIPSGKYCFIVTMSLSRGVLSYIQKSWPQVELLDKDFSQYNEVKWSPGSTQRQEVTSPLSFEADIALSPTVGIIVTTILRVKQKPLPGSNLPTPLRSRVQRVSEKYESLYILVSEANPQGEYVGTPSASDMAAYADFVRFTTSLQAGVTTELIHGAEETLSKWIISLMSRLALDSIQFAHLLSARDTEWGLFLRRAGMNIVASQVLEGLLVADYGDMGMVRFLSASIEERALKYGQVMGGSRVLANICRRLDKG